MLKEHKAFSVLEYAFFVIIVITVMLVMRVYLTRSVSAKWKEGVDSSFGYVQYEPGKTVVTEGE